CLANILSKVSFSSGLVRFRFGYVTFNPVLVRPRFGYVAFNPVLVRFRFGYVEFNPELVRIRLIYGLSPYNCVKEGQTSTPHVTMFLPKNTVMEREMMTQFNFTLDFDNIKEEIMQSNLNDVVKSTIILVFNQYMEKERDAYMENLPYDRNPERKDYRNGYYERD